MNTATPLALAGKSALTLASRRAKVSAISAPMLRAAPMTLAYWKFESISLQQRVHELSVPERDIGHDLSEMGVIGRAELVFEDDHS